MTHNHETQAPKGQPCVFTKSELDLLRPAVESYRELLESPTSADRDANGEEWADSMVAAYSQLLATKLSSQADATTDAQAAHMSGVSEGMVLKEPIGHNCNASIQHGTIMLENGAQVSMLPVLQVLGNAWTQTGEQQYAQAMDIISKVIGIELDPYGQFMPSECEAVHNKLIR